MLRRRLGLSAAAILLVAIPVTVVKKLDEDNRFCVACHLHGREFREMVGTPGTTLASAHHGAEDRHQHPERCFTCHSGEGITGWTAVTALSAYDAARWVLGDRHESTTMRLPIEDRACTKCHAADLAAKMNMAAAHQETPDEGFGEEGSQEASADQNFHQIRDHRNVRTACVTCHTIHTTGEKTRLFMQPAVVQEQCRNCHKHGLGTER